MTPHFSSSSSPTNAGIVGLGMCVPERILTNDELSRMVDTSDEWIRSRTGIKQRHVADASTSTSDLAIIAARRALEDAGIEARSEERRVGKECAILCRSRWSPYH